ncbi:bifunctional DNA primase/polymerase [Actinacidiphila bryophytorum]|uniref:Bifunctional DNA primase/polymerase, N-terminal n=1 Tax=Actinacidiphila bryophytorum TaxID=1436133 RepID=A0A9W4E770_9ACTN|nr:bifunctional DNA primase/polymerase [Actinacidiphila bryophytorum]MBM9435541.1 bifunctional DNA primase/polymerase [Actinacidiphila bryophytorum]MBN6546186.1 bifunctional DNA primase/polymerase [Actinacidiphila bryophytorum]CAG7609286.1 Bifunctional DNA primase/polymerase, N-terminal [Actinacidiphila bryophytorum]
MVFTIGSMRESRQQRNGVREALGAGARPAVRTGVRRRTHAGVCTTVGDYAGRCGWAVVPGARVARGGGACSCGNAECREPGAHPLPFADEIPAGAAPAGAAEAWARVPGAAVLLPAGRSFDVIEVAEAPGRRALVRLERMGLRLGPVLLTPAGRAQFFVAPGAAAELPHLLYRMGWDDAELDLRCLGPGDHVTAPPSDLGGLGPVRWLREPLPGTAPQPPEARLLLGTLAFVCHRARAYA